MNLKIKKHLSQTNGKWIQKDNIKVGACEIDSLEIIANQNEIGTLGIDKIVMFIGLEQDIQSLKVITKARRKAKAKIKDQKKPKVKKQKTPLNKEKERVGYEILILILPELAVVEKEKDDN